MTQIVKITPQENDNVYILFSTYTSYMNVLQFFMNNNMSNNETFDKKWNEAVELDRQLTKAKQDIEKKYKPAGEWDRFEFNFDNQTVVFIKDDT